MKINYNQLQDECGFELKGMITKGEKVTFLNLSSLEETNVRIALELHVAKEDQTITNEDLLKELKKIK